MKTILFYYDEEGRHLLKPAAKDGLREEAPRKMTVAQVGAKDFILFTTEVARKPAIQVRRSGMNADPDRDAWNEDGRPPTVMFSLLYPTVAFFGDAIEIVGLEDPNMSHAGLLHPPYYCCKPLKGVEYASQELWDRLEKDRYDGSPCSVGMGRRQKVVLLSRE